MLSDREYAHKREYSPELLKKIDHRRISCRWNIQGDAQHDKERTREFIILDTCADV
uniref:Uncharacterized protein n=1 Tax=Oryza sativa subsp. japonica TaxID=39947 RepID=Q69KI6_ORYSJ|nr:hypothetical protein [Oryza sativa Japonica Group]BAD36554.1 hypothetical protein [Oryza sativa Japonica Group]